jgi:hypothetical protein
MVLGIFGNSVWVPFLLPLSASLLSRRRCRAPPARRAGTPPAKSNFVSPSRGFPTSPWTHCPRALELPSFATPPRTSSRLPPRRRRGPSSAAPRTPILRAPQHPWRPSIAIHSPTRSLPTLNPQNIAAAPCELRRAHPHRGAAIPEQLHPYSPHQ